MNAPKFLKLYKMKGSLRQSAVDILLSFPVHTTRAFVVYLAFGIILSTVCVWCSID